MEKLPKKRKTEESDLQSKILKYLRSRDDILCARTDVQSPKDVGMQDITCVLGPHGHYFAIELKKPKGGKQSDEQKIWQSKVESLGGTYIMARSLEEVINSIELTKQNL